MARLREDIVRHDGFLATQGGTLDVEWNKPVIARDILWPSPSTITGASLGGTVVFLAL